MGEDMVDLVDIVTTLANVRLKPMLDSSVDTMVDLVVDMVDLVDIVTILANVRLKPMLDSSVDTMVDLLATVVDFMEATMDTVGNLPNRRANKGLLSPFKIHTFDLNKLDK